MALYMLITSALIANLYTRYCDRETNECREDVEAKFIIFPVFGFIIMAIWVSSINQICDHTLTELLLRIWASNLKEKALVFYMVKIIHL